MRRETSSRMTVALAPKRPSFAQRRAKNPFITGTQDGVDYQATDAASRLDMAKDFNAAQCEAALKVRGIQTTVMVALARRLRKLIAKS